MSCSFYEGDSMRHLTQRAIITAAILVLALISLVPSTRVLATSTAWRYVMSEDSNFSAHWVGTGTLNGRILDAAINSGSRTLSSNHLTSGAVGGFAAGMLLPSTSHISHISLTFATGGGSHNPAGGGVYHREANFILMTTTWYGEWGTSYWENVAVEHCSVQTSLPVTCGGDVDQSGIVAIFVQAGCADVLCDSSEQNVITQVVIDGESDTPPDMGSQITRPVDSHFEVQASVPDVVTQANAQIHSPIDGVVTSVTGGESGRMITLSNVSYHVVIAGLSEVYVVNGDTVSQGCVLGLAGPPGVLAHSIGGDQTNLGQFSIVIQKILDSSFVDWETFPDPATDAICGQYYHTPNCITNNPILKDFAAGWGDSGRGIGRGNNPGGLTGFISLEAGAYAYQSLVLVPDIDYYLNVQARPNNTQTGGTFATLSVQLGDVTTSADVAAPTSSSPDQYTSVNIGPLHPTVPDSPGNVYQLKLGPPASGAGVTLGFICLTTSAIVTPPTICYFQQADSFGAGTDWTLSSGASLDDSFFLHSVIIPAPDDYITQPIELRGFPDKEAQYRLTVTVHLVGPGVLTLNSPDNSATMEASIVGEDTHTLDTMLIHALLIDETTVSNFSVPTDGVWSGDFYLKATDSAGAGTGIKVSRVCISLLNSSYWPGYGSSDAPTGGTGQTTQTCQPWPMAPSAAPEGTTLGDVITSLWNISGAWSNYIIAVIVNMWFCYIAEDIALIGESVVALSMGLGLVARWAAAELGALLSVIGLALKAVWFAFLASLATVVNALFGTDVLKWLFDNLSWAAALFATLWNLLLAFLALISWFLHIVSLALQAAGAFAAALPGAINSTPSALTFTGCAAPAGSMVEFCTGLGLMDRMMGTGAGTVIDFLFYLMVGLVALAVILWHIGKTERIIVQAAQIMTKG
jgi:hypothetical protein